MRGACVERDLCVEVLVVGKRVGKPLCVEVGRWWGILTVKLEASLLKFRRKIHDKIVATRSPQQYHKLNINNILVHKCTVCITHSKCKNNNITTARSILSSAKNTTNDLLTFCNIYNKDLSHFMSIDIISIMLYNSSLTKVRKTSTRLIEVCRNC